MNRFEFDFTRIFLGDRNEIDPNDQRALQIQADLDAEHERQARSQKQIYHPPGTIAPRRISEAVGPDGNFKLTV